jgi:uncharacterized SAM-binding protein YcdF (DUF218 family)
MPNWVVDWLSQPQWVALAFLVVMVPPWLKPKWRKWQWGRSLSKRLAIVLLAYFVLISPPAVALGLRAIVAPLPKDLGTTVDAIVMVGRGSPMTPGRVELAAKLWKQGRAPLIVASGVYDAPRMMLALQEQGVPSSAVVGEDCSLDTWQNALYTASILFPQDKRRIILISDAPHLWRSHLIYNEFGFSVIPLTSPLPAASTTTQNSLLLQREFWLLGKFPTDEANFGVAHQPPITEAIKRMDQARCKMAGYEDAKSGLQ